MSDRKVLVRYKTNNFQEIPAADTTEVGNGVKASAGGNLALYGATILSDSSLFPTQDGYFDLGSSSYIWNNLYVNSIYGGGFCDVGIAGGTISQYDLIGVENVGGAPKLFSSDGQDSGDRKYVVGVALNAATAGQNVVYQYSGEITISDTAFSPFLPTNQYGFLWLSPDIGKINSVPVGIPGFVNQKIGNIIKNIGDGFVKFNIHLGHYYVAS